MNNAEVVSRVQQMEQYMEEVAEALRNAPNKLKNSDELCKKIAALTGYMDSGQWLSDYEADERGELPEDMKRGVLSQDGLYNLICEIEEMNRTNTTDFSINEMQQMQRTLQNRYKDWWEPIGPETGKNKLLWMIGEVGEVIDIVKKRGGESAAKDSDIRKDLVEELADVLMYYNDVLLCYGITSEELKKAYTEKFERNMTRWKA